MKPYRPGQKEVFKVSRSRIELFTQCPRCFWLDARLKIKRPDSPPFNINKAIDELFKKEFDTYRGKKQPHPIMKDNNLDGIIPYAHEHLDKWRENFVGVQTLHEPTNLLVFGAVDDIWVNEAGELIVVDYKATAKNKPVDNIDAEWQITYKRQMEVYQWLLRQNGFKVSNTGYFVYTNGRMDPEGFFDKLEFTTNLISYTGDDVWVEGALQDMKECLEGDMPRVGINIMGGDCQFCNYAKQRTELTLKHLEDGKNKTKK